MAMARDKRTAGKEFVAELLSLVPDTVRESVATHLQADSILDRIGEGALRHDAFSREMDALRTAQGRVAATEREQTDWWNTNRAALEEHARGQGRRRAADDDDDDPLGVRRREPTLKVEDVKKTATDITTAAMNQVEAQGITLIGMIT